MSLLTKEGKRRLEESMNRTRKLVGPPTPLFIRLELMNQYRLEDEAKHREQEESEL